MKKGLLGETQEKSKENNGNEAINGIEAACDELEGFIAPKINIFFEGIVHNVYITVNHFNETKENEK